MSYKYNPLIDKRLDYYKRLDDPLTIGEIITTGQYGITYQDAFWDDLRFPFIGQQIDTSAGRLDYNYSELGVGFESNSRYPEEVIAIIVQLSHSWKIGTDLHPHLHYVQNQNKTPNWLLEYRVYENGDTVPAVWIKSTGFNIFTYPGAGSILQKFEFDSINTSSITTLSAFIDIKLYRDTGNVSGEFSGVDTYSGTVLSKELDIHIEIDAPGSSEEYIK